ncbi:MAG: hypothetical protein HKM94_03195 [Halobacteria archaeon]|nr:hypothetical protein [Halobacteria archaeon]
MVKIAADLRTMQDRPAAIVAAALVEDALEDALMTNMAKLSRKERDALFLGHGPLATFSAKISIARAFKLLGKEEAAEIDVIRTIRNVFAHARIAIDFNTPEVAAQIEGINVIKRLSSPFYEVLAPSFFSFMTKLRLKTPRDVFLASASLYAFNLWWLPPDLQDYAGDDDT